MATAGEQDHDEQLALEQAYADWSYECVDRMRERILGLSTHVGTDNKTIKALHDAQQERLRALDAVDGNLIIGRLDLDSAETFYIGRAHVDGDDRLDVAVVDYRADLGERFYQHRPEGVARRRTIKMEARRIRAFSDDVFVRDFVPPSPVIAVAPAPTVEERAPLPDKTPAAPVVAPDLDEAPAAGADSATTASEPVEALPLDAVRARDLLLEELDRTRTGEMADIVATIQAEQDELIRASADGILCVQGGPGTGKTIVGLQRAAYLLYQSRDKALRETSVLIVGPNDRFISYISAVLPSLGEQSAEHRTLRSLAVGIMSKSEQSRLTVRAEDTARQAGIKGRTAMASIVTDAVWSMTQPRGVEVGFGRFFLRLTEADIADLLRSTRAAGLSYDEARRGLRHEVRRALLVQLNERDPQARVDPDDPDSTQAAAVNDALRAQGLAEAICPQLSARAVVDRLLTDGTFLAAVAGDRLTPAERRLVVRDKVVRGAPWTEADVALVGVAALEIHGVHRRFGHVVVDEAQDLSPVQWNLVRRHAERLSVTAVGDLAQATAPGAAASWSDVIGHLGGEGAEGVVAELRLGYRVPAEVMAYAGLLLPTIDATLQLPEGLRSTENPRVIRTSKVGVSEAVQYAERSLPTGARAVIASAQRADHLQESLAPDTVVLTAEAAKGLEFDHVIVVEPAELAGGARGHSLLFVALTRATKQLVVVRNRALPLPLRDALPEETFVASPPAPVAEEQPTAKTRPRPTARRARQLRAAGAEERQSTDAVPVPEEAEDSPERIQGTATVKRLRRAAVRTDPRLGARPVTRVGGHVVVQARCDGWLLVTTPKGIVGWIAVDDCRSIDIGL